METLKDKIIESINAEPELPGQMPEEIFESVRNDKDAFIELLRITVRETKKGIKERILSRLKDEGEDFPDIDFRRDIANELSRDELIDRLCEMNESYRKMREEWFNVIHLKGKKIQDVSTFTSTDYHSSVEPAEQSDKLTADSVIKKITTDFFYYWWNTPGKNTSEGFDEWWRLHKQDYHSQFVGEKVTDEMIEKWAVGSFAHVGNYEVNIAVGAAKAMRDGKIK